MKTRRQLVCFFLLISLVQAKPGTVSDETAKDEKALEQSSLEDHCIQLHCSGNSTAAEELANAKKTLDSLEELRTLWNTFAQEEADAMPTGSRSRSKSRSRSRSRSSAKTAGLLGTLGTLGNLGDVLLFLPKFAEFLNSFCESGLFGNSLEPLGSFCKCRQGDL